MIDGLILDQNSVSFDNQDSSALIASHSRKKPYKDGRVGMTLTYIPFNGDEARELPFVAPDADYQHPYFDALDYTLYFASNVDGGKGGYDLYKSTLSFDGNRDIRKSGFLKFPDFRKSDFRKFGFSNTRKSGFSDFRTSRFPKIRISGNPKIRNFGFPRHQM